MHDQCAHCSHHGDQRTQKRPAKKVKLTKSTAVAGEQMPAKTVLLSRQEAAAYLGLSVMTLAIWKSSGRYSLPVIKVGRLAKYRQSDLDAFLERNTWDGGKQRGR